MRAAGDDGRRLHDVLQGVSSSRSLARSIICPRGLSIDYGLHNKIELLNIAVQLVGVLNVLQGVLKNLCPFRWKSVLVNGQKGSSD